MAEVKIRLATFDDTTALIKFFKEEGILRWFPMENNVEVDDAVRLWMSYVKQKAVLAAEVNGQVVGLANLYLSFFRKISHHALFAIIVDSQHRSQRIGTKLVKELMKIAKERFNLEFLHLEVYEHNPAISLYQRLDFVEYGRQKRFIKEENGNYLDKIMMQKKL